MSDGKSCGHRGRASVQDVSALVARGQHLVDSRPAHAYPLAWCVEANFIGDLSAMAMLAASAAAPNRPQPPVG